MAAIKSYVSALREKPHSSITDWVDILTSSKYEAEAYDGIPELVDAINLQAAGPTEASRAIRKKLKHGDSHQQYRALVILNALVENGGHKFQMSFADGQLTDALRHLASDPTTDPKVKKKLTQVFASWHNQFKNDPSMSVVASFYKREGNARNAVDVSQNNIDREVNDKRRKEERLAKEEAKRQLKQLEKQKRDDEATKKRQPKSSKKKVFNFEQEKPQILSTIATASQITTSLVNAIMLVNTAEDSLQSNERVQECLTNAKQARKQVVRYIQLVENEEMIGALIETNERIIAAIETYDKLSNPTVSERDVTDVQNGLIAVNLNDSELSKLQQKQRAAVQRSMKVGSNGKERQTNEDGDVHSDLRDLSFGTLGGALQSKLPPPLTPNSPRSDDDDEHRGTLSDYSDYESSDESSGGAATSQKGATNQSHLGSSNTNRPAPTEDPFADPFADEYRVTSWT